MWAPLQEKDEPSLFELCRSLYREDPSPRPVPDSHLERTLRELRRNPLRGRIVALHHEKELRGYAILISFWSNELGGEVCYVDELYVAPEARGRGYATALIQSIPDRRDLWPTVPVAIDLEVTPANERARALYMRLGFKPAKNSLMRSLR